MKGILIDSHNRTITEVEVVSNNGSQLDSIYSHLKCSIVETVFVETLENNDIYVDEEGLLMVNSETPFFTYEGYPQPLAGNGLVLGYNPMNGNSTDTDKTIEEIKQNVKFYTLSDVQIMMKGL